MEHLIELKDVYKIYQMGDETVHALDGVSLAIDPGEFVAIVGSSGSGKSTAMNIIGCLDVPTSGTYHLGGVDVSTMDDDQQAEIRNKMLGFIFQQYNLIPKLNVLENVMFPLDMFSSMNYRERVRRAQECLDRVNLGDAQLKYPGEISGGMQKRVAIARAIVLNPKYLFCDEPNSGLDPHTSLVIDQLLSSITKEYNITTIINTHDMNSVMGIGENILFIYQGNNEWQGTKDDVMGATNEKLNDLVFASDLFKRVKEVEMSKLKQL